MYLQVSPLGGSRDETWRGQGIRKRSVSWNLTKLSQLRWCNEGFGPCTTQNYLRTKQFVKFQQSGCLCAAKRTGRPGPSSVCERLLPGALRSQNIARAGNGKCLSRVFRAFCATPERERIPAAAVAGAESPESQSSFALLRGFPIAARETRVC